MLIVGLVAAMTATLDAAPEALAAREFAKYCRQITGREPPPATFAVDAALDGLHDEYRVTSGKGALAFRGANVRALQYAVYDYFSQCCGCRWYWDGDSVPQADAVPTENVDLRASSRFEYRGIRYFAHRGLTRFQAEHWGFEDWTREIDWCVKNRLNLFMLRIGQDDLFQKAFPETCPYPDPSKPVPEALDRYDNRSLFWSLQFRGKLRKKVMDYAFARGLMSPEDFGTMSHWYSRTPYSFLDRMKPAFLPQQGGSYGHETDRVWDIRDRKWLDAYWKLTQASIDNYGRPDLLHTIGIAERHCFTNRADNLRMKLDLLNRLVDNARSHYPDAPVLFAGWDFYLTWKAEEVRRLLPTLGARNVILWDYEADAYDRTNFTEWDVIGKFPYTFGIFYGMEMCLDVRTCYDRIIARQRKIADDPMCKGYLWWPESSHTDPLGLAYFTANAWRADRTDVNALLADLCRGRYGDQAESLRKVWLDALPVSTNVYGPWSDNAGLRFHMLMTQPEVLEKACTNGTPVRTCADVPRLLRALADVRWEGTFVRRDTIDLARTLADRLVLLLTDDLYGNIANIAPIVGDFTDLLALHTDYSLWDSYVRLDAIEPIRNPDFDKVLFENAVNDYCSSHQYEAFAQVFRPWCEQFARTGKRPGDALLKAARERRLASMAPTLARTPENYRKVLLSLAASCERALQGR